MVFTTIKLEIPISFMISQSLDSVLLTMVPSTGLSETPGDPIGEKENQMPKYFLVHAQKLESLGVCA